MTSDLALIAACMLSLGTSIMGMGWFIFYSWNKENDNAE